MELQLGEKKEEESANNGNSADETGENNESVKDNTGPEKDQEKATVEEHEETPDNVKEQSEAPPAVQQKQENVLNLNNEVVKMRKVVKKVKALVIRKLARQIVVLKKKKGKDADLERNKRRAARLLEEIHAIKTLVPDKVTKTALQKNLSFEQVCKDPKSSISDRATARIATYPQFGKKIEEIKAAVDNFKEVRLKEGKSSGKAQKKSDKPKKQAQQTDTEKKSNKPDDKSVRAVVIKQQNDSAEESLDNSSLNSPCVTVERKVKEKDSPKNLNKTKKLSPVKHIESPKPQTKTGEKKTALRLSEVPVMEAESDLELSDGEEKEYFDDSTEERFHKQSSAESEESDNDFFVGKVSKFKKKKKTRSAEQEKPKRTSEENSNPLQSDKVQSELDELESRLKSKAPSMNSVFCSSLSKQKTGKAAGKGDKFKRKDDASDGSVAFSKQFKFQKQHKGKHTDSDSKYKPVPGNKLASGREQSYSGGRGRGKEYAKPKNVRERSAFSHQAPAQPLHPSWEASKKRKEQQSQILAFQGKKIKFDDDD